jgi:hypothetical protein
MTHLAARWCSVIAHPSFARVFSEWSEEQPAARDQRGETKPAQTRAIGKPAGEYHSWWRFPQSRSFGWLVTGEVVVQNIFVSRPCIPLTTSPLPAGRLLASTATGETAGSFRAIVWPVRHSNENCVSQLEIFRMLQAGHSGQRCIGKNPLGHLNVAAAMLPMKMSAKPKDARRLAARQD